MSQDPAPFGNSFIDRFDHTSLQENPAAWAHSVERSMPAALMQTPPPTRDASSRRKPQQPQIKFATPSTAGSRRKSGPSASWNRSNTDHATLDVSPLHFSPGFSPPESLPFGSTGPATAPAQQHGNIFWDPSATHDVDLSFPSPTNNLFHQSFYGTGDLGSMTQSSPLKPRHSTVRPRQARARIGGPLDHSQRPQSAQPHDTARSGADDAASFYDATSVDPSMLWSGGFDPMNQRESLTISDYRPKNVSQAGAPYKFHFDERKREKEDRQLRASLQKRAPSSSSSSDRTLTLRRSLTDSRACDSHLTSRNSSTTSSSDLGDITNNLQNVNVPRESSPLKRQKSSHQTPSLVPAQTRKSVTLTVDQKGRAKTVVRPIQGHNVAGGTTGAKSPKENMTSFNAASPPNVRYSDSVVATKPSESLESLSSSNAQEALRQMKRERHLRENRTSKHF